MKRPERRFFEAFFPRKRPVADARFASPPTATSIRRPVAIAFMVAVIALAIAAAVVLPDFSAFWPTPMATASTVALAVIVAFTGSYGTFETIDGLAAYSSLSIPFGYAMVLLLDWRHFVAAVALGELLVFVVESLRGINPTKWYIRAFNASELTLAGLAVSFGLREARSIVPASSLHDWTSPVLFLMLGSGAVVWKLMDDGQTRMLLGLATNSPAVPGRRRIAVALSELGLVSIGIPFAFAWQSNFWIALFALAPLVAAFQALGIPELEHRANVDERTGLANTAAFDVALEQAIADAEKSDATLALISIDIDRFKAINDHHGHLVGDTVIKGLARVLSDSARRGDVAARVGGEEFAFILQRGDRAGAVRFAERLRSRIAAESFETGGVDMSSNQLAVTASFGVAMFPDDGATPRALSFAADTALYAAKRGGRNRVCEASLPGGATPLSS